MAEVSEIIIHSLPKRGKRGDGISHNSRLVSLMQQMVLLKNLAEEIFSRVRCDVEQVACRSEQLTHRLNTLQTAVENLPNPRTLKTDTPNSLIRYTLVKTHFLSEKLVDGAAMFCAATRPAALQRLYAAAGGDRDDAPATENISTQTEEDPPITEEETADFPHPYTAVQQTSRDDGVQRNSLVFDDRQLPTPEKQTSSIATMYKSAVVAIDTSGMAMQRMSAAREGRKLRKLNARRNTVAIASLSPLREQSGGSPPPVSQPQELPLPSSPVYEDFSQETTYDVLPFQKRRNKLLPLPANPFSSLRRIPKRSRESLSYGSLKRHPVSTESDRFMSDGSKSSDSVYGEFKKLIRRSVSLRLSQRKKMRNDSEDYDELPIPRKVPHSEFSRNSLKKKLSLPISTTSQVLQLATMMREQPGFKHRPVSIISTTSNMSLELGEKNSSGWYRQGYQLDVPEECIRMSSPIENGVSSEVPSDVRDEISSGQSSPRDPVGDSSSDPDSNYSCDQEGYYTSMHRDSGLNQTSKRVDFRGRSFSTHSSSSTVAEPHEKCRPGSSDSGAEDLQSPMGCDGGKPDFLAKLAKIAPRNAFPPLCEVSASSGGESDINSPQFTRSPLRATLPARRPALPRKQDKVFDDWLLKKFQDELSLKGRRSPTSQVKYAVPMRKAVRFCE